MRVSSLIWTGLALGVLAACGRGAVPVVSQMSPPEALRCVETVMERHSIGTDPAPFPQGVWRLRLSVLSGPPVGWIEKGSIVHTGTGLSYIADGATKGLNERQVQAALETAFARCA